MGLLCGVYELLSVKRFENSAQHTASTGSLFPLLLLLKELPRCSLCFQSLNPHARTVIAPSVPTECSPCASSGLGSSHGLLLFLTTICTPEITLHFTDGKTEAQKSSSPSFTTPFKNCKSSFITLLAQMSTRCSVH